MLDPQALYEYSRSLGNTNEGLELQHRLSLFQVFSRLYDRHPDLLAEILDLDSSVAPSYGSHGFFSYVQAVVIGGRAYLMTNLADGRSQALAQSQQIWTIGRDSQQVVIPIRDKRLSRRHAAIHYHQNQFRLVDLGSTNGSFVNGERIRNQYSLRDGDRIRLGSVTFSFFICHDWQELPQVPEADVRHIESVEPASPRETDETVTSSADVAGAIPAFVLEETLRFIRNQGR
ncbi:phosphopeptide-binding protein [filamentous cyanobacterium CCP5]|nr:phosphopeptide-binding protein [filamentous cyanobacterium CCP5]